MPRKSNKLSVSAWHVSVCIHVPPYILPGAYALTRGLDGATAKKWELGYAPPEWDALLKVFGQSEEARQQLVQLGMLTRNDNGKLYDRFRGRLMFTIRDKRGKVCGFGGRVMAAGGRQYERK